MTERDQLVKAIADLETELEDNIHLMTASAVSWLNRDIDFAKQDLYWYDFEQANGPF